MYTLALVEINSSLVDSERRIKWPYTAKALILIIVYYRLIQHSCGLNDFLMLLMVFCSANQDVCRAPSPPLFLSS